LIVILKPKGKGNWAPLTMQIDGRHVTPLSVRVGQLLPIGGIVFRVCEVRP
jgi:hypothetical protein